MQFSALHHSETSKAPHPTIPTKPLISSVKFVNGVSIYSINFILCHMLLSVLGLGGIPWVVKQKYVLKIDQYILGGAGGASLQYL